MIALDHVSCVHRAMDGPLVVLSDMSIAFQRGERVGILAAAGSGKSTIARMLAGVEKPHTGRVYHQGKVSWPIGFSGGFHPELTAMENITYLSELVGVDPLDAIAFCIEFAKLGPSMGKKLKMFSSAESAALSYSFSLAVPCDMYVADEVIGIGDKDMRMRCQVMLERRLENAGLVFLSKSPAQLEKNCNRFFVLIDGKFLPCPDVEVGAAALALSQERRRTKEPT